MRRPILTAAVLSLVALGLSGCVDESDLTRPLYPSRASNGLTPIGPIERPPVRPQQNDFVEITAGDYHTCARKLSGKVYCWGDNNLGQGGSLSSKKCSSGGFCLDRPTVVRFQPTPNASFDTLRAASIDAGANHNCVLDSASDAWCWGDSNQGQTGFQANAYTIGWPGVSYPSLVVGGLKWSSISAGFDNTCGTTSGGMFCWGRFMNRAASPTLVSSFNQFTTVTVGAAHACSMEVLNSYRAVDCWGDNSSGQLVIDPAQLKTGPFAVRAQFGTTVSRVSTQHSFTCADQLADTTVQCAGSNEFAQLAMSPYGLNPNTGWMYATGVPNTVGGGKRLRGVTTGPRHACALDPAGYAWCWGWGYWGQVGNGAANNDYNPTPFAVGGGHTYRAIAAGLKHSCAIGTDNHIYCWGNNHEGQLGTQYPGGWVWIPVQALDPIA